MKRTKTIVADDGANRVSVSLKVETDDLTRDEAADMVSRLTDGVMTLLGNTRHLHVYMSDIRVR